MLIRLSVLAVLTVVPASALLFCPPARADKAKEAGPEDGVLCCNGLVRFLFDDDKVMTVTGRAGAFRSDDRGGSWRRSMDGLVAANGVAPFVGFACNSPSKPLVDLDSNVWLTGFGLASRLPRERQSPCGTQF